MTGLKIRAALPLILGTLFLATPAKATVPISPDAIRNAAGDVGNIVDVQARFWRAGNIAGTSTDGAAQAGTGAVIGCGAGSAGAAAPAGMDGIPRGGQE
jgi:hypothetical protein